ncbi:MAG TPA: cation-translocating P-type ATPase [Pyrinomonadaceae bacterium]|nr:cation-translocating P-type ATPase [Pyrinomonadaceae bacterium]
MQNGNTDGHSSHEHDHEEEHSHADHPSKIVLNPDAAAERETILAVAGMDCAEEVAAIQRALKPLPGVREIRTNLLAGKATIMHDASMTPELLIEAIGREGLKATVATANAAEASETAQRPRLISVLISGICTGLGLLIRWRLQDDSTTILIFAVAIVSGGWFILPKAVRALRRFALDMNVLMTVAVAGAAAIGEWQEGAAVAFLFSLSELLESFSVARARKALSSLMKLSPPVALLKDGESFLEVPVEQVKPNNVIVIKSGARIPLDGEVIGGESAVNQGPITGESVPVEKEKGDIVFAGTINGEGSLDVRVTKLSTDTTLAKIIHLVEEAQSQKAPSQRFVDVFAKYYTPSVMVLSLLVLLVPPLLFHGAWFTWIYRALVLLVIACPCALVISTPVSIVSGLTAMARRGVLIKGGVFLEAIGKLRALALDKTGTITEGKPRVTKVHALNATPESEIVRIAAAIDAHSEHPLAQAVVDYARKQKIDFARGENYKAHSGRGATGRIDNHDYFLGNHRFTHELAVCSEEIERLLAEIEGEAQSVVVVGHMPHAGCKGEVLGILAVGDAVRANAKDAIIALHKAGVRKVVMLSGDNQRTVDAIAKQAGIDEAYGDLLPDQKVDRIKELMKRERYVGMVGDGVNDAPAMAIATVGIAMGAAGTDTAIETADLALMKDDLGKIAETILLGRRTVRVIQANIVFALLVKAVFLVLAVLGYTSLWLAIAADTGATLVVIANALRLLRVSK